MILIYLLKFFHVLFALSLLSLTTYTSLSNQLMQKKLNRGLLWLSPCALLTGTLLVYPKHFTFHTPWIMAAYFLLFSFSAGIIVLNYVKNNDWRKFIYFILIILLILVIHDAVTKLTIF